MSAIQHLQKRLTRAASMTFSQGLALGILGLLLGLSTSVEAQVQDRRWEIGFGLGSANLDSSAEDFDLDFREDVRAGLFLSDHFEIEAQLIRAQAIFDAEIFTAMANGVFNFRPEKLVVPYALVGVGHAELNDITLNFLHGRHAFPNDRYTETDRESTTAYQAGFGTRFFLGSDGDMALRVEISSLWLDTDVFESDRHTSITAGLSWSLGTR